MECEWVRNAQKKKRFCWDDGLHYKFLENIFLLGIQSACSDQFSWIDITAQKIFDIVKVSIDGISYDFIDSYLQVEISHAPHV